MIKSLLAKLGLRIHWHTQNLNEKPGDELGAAWKHGRAWIRLRDEREHQVGPSVQCEWNHGAMGLAADLSLDRDERSATWHIAIPGLSYFVVLDDLPAAWFRALPFDSHRTQYSYQGSHRNIGLRVHSGSMWLSCWEDGHEWRHDDPWWWRASINFADTLFGRTKHASKVIQARDVEIPMPEGSYPGQVQIEARSWLRPRWPWRPFSLQNIGARVDVPKGIPVPGKGENSWDCGDDALYGLSCEVSTVEEAIGATVASALRTRQRYGGRHTYATVRNHALKIDKDARAKLVSICLQFCGSPFGDAFLKVLAAGIDIMGYAALAKCLGLTDAKLWVWGAALPSQGLRDKAVTNILTALDYREASDLEIGNSIMTHDPA